MRAKRSCFVAVLAPLVAAVGCGGPSTSMDGGSTDGDTGATASLDPCPPYSPGDNLAVCTASYLGGPMMDTAAGVVIGADGSVVIAATLTGVDLGATPTVLLGGTTGAVVRLSPNGRAVRSVTRIGAGVADIDIHRATGRVIVAGDFGVAALDPTASQIVWSHALPAAGVRVAVAADGTVATLTTDRHITVFGPDGTTRSTIAVADQNVLDVAIDSTTQHVFAAGWNQRNVGGDCEGELQVAFLRAYAYDGMVAWHDYDWTADQAQAMSLCADTRGLVVSMGDDGRLYFAGHAAGGNAIYSQDPQQMAQMAANVAEDMYDTPYNTSSNHITYFGRFDPATGALSAGRFLLTRLASGAGNTIVPRAIAADAAGHVFVGGAAAYGVAHGATLQISGMPIGAYWGGNWVLVTSPDLRTRLTWTVFTGTGTGETNGLAVGNGAVALVGDQGATAMGSLLTVDALQATPAGGGDAFVAVWRAP